MTEKDTGTLPMQVERLAKDRADWLLDAIACATQDRRFLRGDPAYDEDIGEAILANGEKAIRVALSTPKPEGETVPDDGVPLGEIKRTWRTGVETGRLLAKEHIIAEARKNLALTQGCLDCNADDERRWADTIRWLEGLA